MCRFFSCRRHTLVFKRLVAVIVVQNSSTNIERGEFNRPLCDQCSITISFQQEPTSWQSNKISPDRLQGGN